MTREDALAALAEAKAKIGAVEAFLLAEAVTQPTPPPSAPVAAPAVTAGLQKPAAFFAHVKASGILGRTLEDDEVAGCNALLDACAGVFPTSWAAYALATPWLETNGTMQPVREAYWLSDEAANRYFVKMYDIEGARPEKARELGNLMAGDGVRYCGRGYVQITGRANYRKLTAALRAIGIDVDLEAAPDKALDPSIAAHILVLGMRDGLFTDTGKSLRTYIPQAPTRAHFVNARRIINGQDRAGDIADAALIFYEALKAGDWR